MHLLAAAAVTLQLALAAAPEGDKAPRARADAERARAGDLDPSTLPPEQRARYDLLRHKCTRCHSLPAALSTPRTPAWWRRHTQRATVALSKSQMQSIFDFLDFYFASRQARP